MSERWVIKIGSALATADGAGVDRPFMSACARQMVALSRTGRELVLVTSGAIAEGCVRLGMQQRPTSINELQAAAAVGQMGLSRAWDEAFSAFGRSTAQILLTHDDLAGRQRYLNARTTLRTLLRMGVLPVVNENDTIATDEIRLGDNDTLGALVANLIEADVLVLMTDQQGLFERDPRQDPAAPLVARAQASDPRLDEMAGDSMGRLGRGGMATKIRAARIAARSGARTIIVGGQMPDVLDRLGNGEALGTVLLPDRPRMDARKQWIASHLQIQGTLVLDDGAVRVLRSEGASLLAIGVVDVRGQFNRGDVVVCVDQAGTEIARGLVNYSADESLRIMRKPSGQFAALLGYEGDLELMHRDNLVLL